MTYPSISPPFASPAKMPGAAGPAGELSLTAGAMANQGGQNPRTPLKLPADFSLLMSRSPTPSQVGPAGFNHAAPTGSQPEEISLPKTDSPRAKSGQHSPADADRQPTRQEIEDAVGLLAELWMAMPVPVASSLNAEVVGNAPNESGMGEMTIALPGKPAMSLESFTGNGWGEPSSLDELTEPVSVDNASPIAGETETVITAKTDVAADEGSAPAIVKNESMQMSASRRMAMELEHPSGVMLRVETVPNPKGLNPEKSGPIARAAEFSLLNPSPSKSLDSPSMTKEKHFLNVDGNVVNESHAEAGIGVANTSAVMPAKAISFPSSRVDDTPPFVLSVATEVARDPAGDGAMETSFDPKLMARNSVEAVTKIVDAQLASHAQSPSSVTLRLQMSNEHLSIRVELRDGEIHTSFRTDSSALRAALGQEWHAAANELSARTVRFHVPQISGDDRSPGDTFGGGSGQFSREQHPARARGEYFPSRGPSSSTTVPVATPVPLASSVRTHERRLSTFA